MRVILIVATLAFVIAPGPAWAQSSKQAPKSSSSARTLSDEFHWWDGERRRSVWFDPYTVAEPSEALAKKQGEAKPERRTHNDRLVTLARPLSGPAEIGTLAERGVAPVFREGASTDAPALVPTGGMIVRLPREWSAERARAWLAECGFAARAQPVGKLPNTWRVEVSDVLEALTWSQRLAGSGEGEAFPDWQMPLVPQ